MGKLNKIKQKNSLKWPFQIVMDSHYASSQKKLLLPQFSGLNQSKRPNVCISTKKCTARQEVRHQCPGCWLLSGSLGCTLSCLSLCSEQNTHPSELPEQFERAFEATLSSKDLVCSVNGVLL